MQTKKRATNGSDCYLDRPPFIIGTILAASLLHNFNSRHMLIDGFPHRQMRLIVGCED